MTAVPKPLKFLMPHYDDLTKTYEEWPAGNEKVRRIVEKIHIGILTKSTELPCRCFVRARHDPRRRREAGNTEIPVTGAI